MVKIYTFGYISCMAGGKKRIVSESSEIEAYRKILEQEFGCELKNERPATKQEKEEYYQEKKEEI